MGDWKRTILFAVAICGIAASLLLPWWRAEFMGATLEVMLRKIEICTQGTCQNVKAGSAYSIVAIMTFAYGWIAVIGLIMGGLVPALSGEDTKGRAYAAALVYLGMAGMTYGTLDIPPEMAAAINLEATWWFWAGIGGCGLVLGSPLLRVFDGKRAPPPLYKVPAIAGTPPAEGLPEARALPGRRAPLEAIELDGSPRPARSTTPPITAPAPAERTGLRFALSTAEAREAALLTVGEDGEIRELGWARIGGALARELTVQPWLDDPLLVDLIPTGEAPLRFLTSTRIQFPGTDATSGRDAMRRLLAFARAMNPDLQVEATTADFLYKRTELPAWSPSELEQYDSRYR